MIYIAESFACRQRKYSSIPKLIRSKQIHLPLVFVLVEIWANPKRIITTSNAMDLPVLLAIVTSILLSSSA